MADRDEQIRSWCADAGDMGDWVFDRWIADHDAKIRADQRIKIAAAHRISRSAGLVLADLHPAD